MTLHEAMIEVLMKAGRDLTTREIADEIARRKLFIRPSDGQFPPPSQIGARANLKTYRHIFEKRGGKIHLKEGYTKQTTGQVKEKPRNDSRTSLQLIEKTISSIDEATRQRASESVEIGSLSWLNSRGFLPIGTLSEVLEGGFPNIPVLSSSGVYAIVWMGHGMPEFFSPTEAQKNGNVIGPWQTKALKEKWVDGAQVVYIGFAGRNKPRSLQSRLEDLLDHGQGRITKKGPHKGGEIFWQLRANKQCSLLIRPTGDPPEPGDTKKELLAEFKSHFRHLPYANLRAW